ncbi:unnamed protein product [Symbiodinium necroappetens]|uniref:Uncharacterized protein n=1 Tax=Symbiodinium necroappetens TaxID=1628268 RepID=A0A813CAH1_9DINO|nr:unnamed protein product [Symbiodinium necroappetens]
MAKHSSVIRPEVRERQKMPASQNSRKHPTGGRRSDLKEVSEWCQKHTMDPTSGRVHRREETRSEILDEPVVSVHEDEEEIDDDMRHFKETIENWNLHTETFPLPIQPVCPTLRPVEERNEDDEPFIMFSHDILVYCYDAPELTYDEHFSKALPDPWRLQFWVRGRNESIALRGLHDQPVTTGYMLETPTQPSKKCEDWMRGGYSISGFASPWAQFVVTHSVDTTVIWRLDRLWQLGEAAARGCKQDPQTPLDIRQTSESPSQLSECRAELWLKNSGGMYPMRRDEAAACFAIVGEYLPGRRHPGYRPDDFNGGVVLKIDSSGLLVLTVARGPDIHVYAISPNRLDVLPVSVVDTVTFSLDSPLELVFPDGSFLRGLSARLEAEGAGSTYTENDVQESKESPSRSKSPRAASIAHAPPSSAQVAPSDPGPKPKTRSQHQVCTPRGTNFQSPNAGRGSLARQASSRSAEIPAAGRVQVSRVGVRPGYQRDGRLAVADRISDKQRQLASQRNSSKTPSSTRPVSTLVRARSNSPRGLGGETPRKSTGPAASHGRIRDVVRSKRLITSLSSGSPTSPTSPTKTESRDVKAATSEGVRLRSRSVSSDSVDRGRGVSKKPVETPSRAKSIEPIGANRISTSDTSSYVPSQQTSHHAVPTVPVSRLHTPGIPSQRLTVATPSGRWNSVAVQVNQQRLQGLSSWPSVWVPPVVPAAQAVVPVPGHVPASMATVSRSLVGHHLEQSRSGLATAAPPGHSATTSHSRLVSWGRWPVSR